MELGSIFLGATLRDRFLAAATSRDETAAQRLTGFAEGPQNLRAQREEAWALLSRGASWAALALEAGGVTGTEVGPIGSSDAAFERAQHFEGQLFALSQIPGFHDREAMVVDAVKQACYAGAELGPIKGGRLAAFGGGHVVEESEPTEHDLQEIGSKLGEALHWLEELGLRNVVEEASEVLSAAPSYNAAPTGPGR